MCRCTPPRTKGGRRAGDHATIPGGGTAPALPPPSARSSGEAIVTACAQCIALCLSVSRCTVYGRLCLPCKEASRMASVRCTDVQARPAVCLDVTSVTRDAFQQLVPPVEAVFQAPLAAC